MGVETLLIKILITVFIALATLVFFRQFSERNKRSRVRIKNRTNAAGQSENLVWDEKSGSYKIED